jgi:hypothetical protein
MVAWGGQFRLQQEANKRLAVVIPITLLIISLLLFSSFNSLKNTLLILLNIPLALVGGVVALVGVLFLSVVGWRLIPRQRRSRLSATDLFEIEDYVTEAIIPEASPLVGRPLGEVDDEADEKNADLLGVVRDERRPRFDFAADLT